jgi:hypothetical protein
VLRRLLVITAALIAAATATVWTAGASAGAHPSSSRAPRALAAGGVPAHTETWAFDDGCNGGRGASARLVRHWLTYAESNCGGAAKFARHKCRAHGRSYCSVMQYLDPDWNFPFDGEHRGLVRRASESWFLHEPGSSSRVFSNSYGGGFLVNQRNQAVRAFFHSFVARYYNRDDGLLLDWQSPNLAQLLYYSSCHCRVTNEIRSSATLRAGHQQMSAALTHRHGAPFVQIDNTLAPNQFLPQGLHMLNHSIGVDGWSAEGEPINYGYLDPFYATLLDQMAYIAAKTRGVVMPLSRGDAGARYEARSRRVQEATVLLAYRPGHVVDWADLEQGTGRLAVWPEEGIYPTLPLQTMHAPGGHGCLQGHGVVCHKGGHNDVSVAHHVYRREFAACYSNRIPIGPCAAIMNTTGHAVTVRRSWLRQTYHHQIRFKGSDVQTGGRLKLRGSGFTAGATKVPAQDAMLLAS